MQKMKVKMLDGSVKTVMADVSKVVGDMLFDVCTKFGITNYDEYGLCHDEAEDPEEVKPATGTLTLKRKNPQRERDVRLEQMSKKLKTDDNVEWLDQKRTLRELKVDPEETLLLKRRLFYSDRKIDARDPVQLNLLYVQTRENILSGRQIVTEEKAAEFAGIQCQIDFGDFEEDKHKPGFIENLTEYLPLQYTSSWGIEKKIYREYSKHKGLSQVDAKYLYTKIAREFPTYGVTFFLVKERQKNKKKLIPRLLGINAKSILRLDENTKEILQVWRITQVQSYHAGNATFTLNFGDYSDKEYSVKTNEAFRIRDILEGYIDIIRKQREGPSNISYVEGAMICEDNVEKSKGHVIQAVEQQSVKVVEQSFVGPSKIISYEPGQQLAQGTQIVTVQQMIITNKENMKQKGMNSETPRSHMLNDFARILNRVNSESVNAVMLLSDPSPSNLQQVRTIANRFVAELPTIVEGVEELAKQQNTEEERKRLLDELDELCKYLNSLGSVAKRSDLEAPENLQTAEKAAKKVAELSTQVMFSLDPKSRRRSEFLRRSRQSFIADERMEATLRRASFLTIASTGCGTLKHAINDLENPYAGPEVNKDNAARLEGSAVNKIGRLNAAVALLLAARADPKNIDYETAINSMTAINELTPLLIKDAKALSSTKDDKNRRELLNKIRDLCETLNNLCAVAGTNTDLDIKNAANNYGKTSGKLIYLFNPKSKGGKRGGLDPDKENEIVDLAKDVGNKTNALVKKAKDLVSAAGNDRRAQVLDAAGAKSADAAKSLLACSQLVAPTIHERHCQSALTATSANLSSSVHLLSQAWKPLVEEQKYQNYGKKLGDKTADLMNALDRLNKAYSSINSNPPAVVDNHELSNEAANMANERKRLQFIASLSTTKQGIREMERELQENCGDLKSEPIKDNDEKEKLRQILSQKVAQLNAATASLLHATSSE
ncbi:uncharacterized protein [Epargyreus clarus]|uniref:uncharacterized protein n=1 Tax=Epargyreus clarus TaxID=520877 RepID=UPI003C2FAEB8